MAKFNNPLDNIKIASPCSADWNEMYGDDRKRFCGQCNLNVYNLSGMTRDEGERLLLASEDRLCVRFFKRADGTIITKNCPVGWAKVKQRVTRMSAAIASITFGILGGFGLNSYFTTKKSEPHMMGAMQVQPTTTMGETSVQPVQPIETMGKMRIEDQPDTNAVMGDVVYSTDVSAGGISNLDQIKKKIIRNQRR